eukprot:Awhi_evm1s3331
MSLYFYLETELMDLLYEGKGFEKECMKCTEALFDPSLISLEDQGIHHLLLQSIQSCDPDVQRFLYGSCVLSGGNTQFPGFGERLEKEFGKLLVPSKYKLKVFSPKTRPYSTWIGGAIQASLHSNKNVLKWVSQEEYDEHGPSLFF